MSRARWNGEIHIIPVHFLSIQVVAHPLFFSSNSWKNPWTKVLQMKSTKMRMNIFTILQALQTKKKEIVSSSFLLFLKKKKKKRL